MADHIQLIGIKKLYAGEHVETAALHEIHRTFRRDEFTAIIGSSGSGKSTLLSLVGTLDQPSSGRVLYGDLDTSKLNANQLADFRFERIGLVFQHFHLLPALTAIENVMSPFFGRRRRALDHRAKAKRLLDRLGLAGKYHSLPSQLSGGEQQRVAIARALVNDPDWLLADEPTGNLDSRNAELFYELLQELKRELGCGIILVTHDLQLARKADRIIEIKDGLIVGDSSQVTDESLC
ncbi:ABC transporter ATP-binding protein [Paenibacillus sacheonensis]|uniref:ATP-binding cassette domain-containing protein n=1 Tax=Paenibacillus sacheonensis TaxID=742054 RepID=A0A7X5C0S2_9BACL|nr:ABC transporter ATP-binding protein [Paenibacillus sacheonensis]MBM7568117.1 ABC-type lipoprotein export system ATPase subunit [Paenibacillus sacheonensis]NBC71881.1 ATP-binding cassette domain-containing protein [Paenibacillus sacheonensis]